MKRTKLDFEDWKFVLWLFFHSIGNLFILRFDQSKFQWMLMRLTAGGHFDSSRKITDDSKKDDKESEDSE